MVAMNWAGNHAYPARAILRPTSLEQLQEIVATTPRVRALGSRHSFNAIADSPLLVELDALPAAVTIDRRAMTATVPAGGTYGELAVALQRERLALANLASLPQISVAGAIATATHGSGDANGNLATAVAGLQLVGADGERYALDRSSPDFPGFVVGLGALGLVVAVTLDLEPAYQVSQWVIERTPLAAVLAEFDAVTGAGYSVSLFTTWDATVDQIWVKRRAGDGPPELPSPGGTLASAQLHPSRQGDPDACTPQLGVPGLWSQRLPHFRMGFTPSIGAELQSEFFVDRERAIEAIEAVAGLGDRLRPILRVSEIRTVARDDLWLSPQYRRDAVGIHFTWRRLPTAVHAAVRALERVLAPFDARPHWGKVFVAETTAVRELYPRLDDFTALVERVDPERRFGNAWLDRHVLAPTR